MTCVLLNYFFQKVSEIPVLQYAKRIFSLADIFNLQGNLAPQSPIKSI